MKTKWCLLKSSEIGPMGRGQSGKKKVYEVRIEGTTVTCEWGMAEKLQRQRLVKVCSTQQGALAFAYEKVNAKIAGGYEIAYAV